MEHDPGFRHLYTQMSCLLTYATEKRVCDTGTPCQPIAAGTIIQIKLNWISDRQSFVSQVGTRLILDHGGPKIPVIIPDKLSVINKCQKMGVTFDVNRPFSQAIDVNLGITSRPPKTLPRS